MQKHIDKVKDIYAAFGRGDIDTLIANAASDIEWDPGPDRYGVKAGIAALKPRRGHAGMREFFLLIGTWTFHRFDVRDVLASGSRAMALVSVDVEIPGAGRFADEEVHLFEFGSDGKTVLFRHFLDTANLVAAHKARKAA
jgi:ketosteroid isomerase-like protein